MVPIGNSASGWAYLALLDAETRADVLSGLEERDPSHAAVAAKHFPPALKSYEKLGYIVNTGVFYPGLTSLAVPFRSSRRGSIYVVSCTAMSAGFPPGVRHKRAAEALSQLANQLINT